MNPFDNCKNDSEVMKLMFELSSSDKFTSEQIRLMALKRRQELAVSSKKSSYSIKRVSLLKTDYDKLPADKTIQVINPLSGNSFEFLGDGIVRF